MKNNKWSYFSFNVFLFIFLLGCVDGFQAPLDLSSIDGPIPPPTENIAGPDPLFSHAWHLQNTGQRVFASVSGVTGQDLNLQNTWNQNIYGQGVLIRVSDDGIDDAHPDLTSNFNYNNLSRRYNGRSTNAANFSRPLSSDDNHGTAVAGIIAASFNNSLGASGVAPQAQITSANFLSENSDQTMSQLIDQASGEFDILNMSWGYSQNVISEPYQPLIEQFKYNVENGRGGKGSLMVKASGNNFFIQCNNNPSQYCVGNSNMDGDNSSPYTLLITALDSQGRSATYSSAGSNVWVAAPGGEDGINSAAILTTDRSGCSAGYAHSNATSSVNFERGGDGNTDCNYTAFFSGTSAAAPMASGAIALIMQANPQLNWREIKYILAKTAVPSSTNMSAIMDHPLKDYFGITLPTNYIWESPWITNGANFNFHNWYGFGRIDVDAAVTLAQNFNENLGTFTTTNWIHNRTGLGLNIPDNSTTGISNTLNVTQNIKIEGVQIKLNVTHIDISELAIELTSPSGTKSILMNMRNSLTGIGNYTGNEVLLSNAFYQESSQGEWTLKIVDGKSTQTGTLSSWSLNFFGGQ